LTVFVDYDVYDPNDVKVGTGYDIVKLDPYGQSKYEVIAFGAGDKGARGGTYRIYIGNYY